MLVAPSMFDIFSSLNFLLSGTVIRDEVGLTLDKAGKEVLGNAAKVVLTKDSTTIVGDGSTQDAVNKRVAQIKNLIEVNYIFLGFLDGYAWSCQFCCLIHISLVQVSEQEYEKEKLNERIAKLSGGVAVIQVCYQ